jgi:tetratricopeptide (TPR) repeat protein
MSAQRNVIGAVSITLFAAAFAFYSIVIFALLPPSQSQKYLHAAEALKNGNLESEQIFDYSPLYLKVHVTASRFFQHVNLPLAWLQIFLTASAILIYFYLSLRYFPLWLSVTTTIALILQRSIIVYTQLFEPEPFLLFFLLLFLLFASSSSSKLHLLSGFALGLAILTRPSFAPLVAIIPVYFWLINQDLRSKLTSIALCATPSLAAVLLILIYMAFSTGYFSMSWLNPGISIYESNNPLSSGTTPVPLPMIEESAKLQPASADNSHVIYRQFARSVTGLHLTFPETNRYWLTKAITFWEDHPRYFFTLILNKARYFFHEYQWHDLTVAFWNETLLREFGIPSVPFALISSIAFAGFCLGLTQIRKWFLIYSVFILHFILSIFVQTSAAHRIAVLPLFFFFLSVAVTAFYSSWRKLIWLLLVIPLIWVFYSKTAVMNEETLLKKSIRASAEFTHKAYARRSAEDWLEASESASRALAAAPFLFDLQRPAYLPFVDVDYFTSALAYIPVDTPEGLFNRAVICIPANRPGEAEIALREVVKSGVSFKRNQYHSSQPYYFLARSSWLRGNKDEAINRLHKALSQAPGDPWCLAALAVMSKDPNARKKLEQYYDQIDAQFFLSEAGLQFGTPAVAVSGLTDLLTHFSKSRRIKMMLAAALSQTGQSDVAAETYRAALRQSLDPAILENEVLYLFRHMSENNPNDPEGLYMYGFVLRQYGHYTEALQVQYSALEKSQSPAIRAEIVELQRVLSKLQ